MPVPTAWRSDGCVCNHAVSKPTKTMLYDREGVSFPVQIALLHPTDDEPFYFAYTMGMSAAPMVGPAESMECETLYSELCLLIPNNWFCHCAEKDIAQSWPLE